MKLQYTSILCCLMIATITTHVQSQSLEFDGLDDHVVATGSALNAIGSGNFTIELWVKGLESEVPSHAYLMSNRGLDANGTMLFIHELWGASQYKMLAIQLAGANYMLENNGTLNGPILDGDCHHVAVVREGDSLSFYFDGALFGKRGLFVLPASVTNSGGPLLFGKDMMNFEPYKGSMGHVRIWSVARTQTEVAASYQQFVPFNTPGLAASWAMNEGSGQTILEGVANDDGILGNQPGMEPSDPTWIAGGCELLGMNISESDFNSGLALWPNPATGSVCITWQGTDGILHVLDGQGRIVMETVFREDQSVMDLSGLASGTYVVQITSEDRFISARLVKD